MKGDSHHGKVDEGGGGREDFAPYARAHADYLDRPNHSEKDRIARKQRLGVVVKIVRASKLVATGDPKRPNERIYSGLHNGKSYICVADEHGELDAFVMVSYRRDSRNDEG